MMDVSAYFLPFAGVSMPQSIPVLACFDESGKLKDSEFVAFGGIVCPASVIQSIFPVWQDRLKKDGLSHISMKEAIRLDGPFFKWRHVPDGKELRDAVVSDLATIIAGMTKVTSECETSVFKSLPQKEREKFGNDPQYACFETCIRGALTMRNDFQLQVVCDLSEEYSEKCVSLFHKLRRRHPDIKARTLGICFSDDDVHIGIQAADMVAYCHRANSTFEKNRAEPHPLVVEIIRMFSSADVTNGVVTFGPGGLGTGTVHIQGIPSVQS
jgi:Protein of unknown function (DUF3800)